MSAFFLGSDMGIDIRRESALTFSEYARVPIAFEVSEIFDVAPGRQDQFTLVPRRPPRIYVKDYDAIGERPVDWPKRFDVSNWAFFSACMEGQRIGGAAVAYKTPSVEMLEGRDDLALLWDIRVDPANRRRGVGTALFDAAATWAMSNGCRQLKVETQNTNVVACRFYARHGCVLRLVRHGVYAELPDEIQLLWYKDLPGGATD